jgi:hypothetical protein
MSPTVQIARRDKRLEHDKTWRNGQVCSKDRERGPTRLAKSVIVNPHGEQANRVFILRVSRSLPGFPDKQSF